MGKYPTNIKRLTSNISTYAPGTRFRTANGIVVAIDENDYDDYQYLDELSLLIISYPEGLYLSPGKRRSGRWHADGRKKYASEWPPGSDIVEVLP